MTPDFRPKHTRLSWEQVLEIRWSAKHLHSLGPRPLYEFLVEILNDLDPRARAMVVKRLCEYEGLDVDTLRKLDAVDLRPLPPLKSVT